MKVHHAPPKMRLAYSVSRSLSVGLSVCLSACLSVCLAVCLSCCLSDHAAPTGFTVRAAPSQTPWVITESQGLLAWCGVGWIGLAWYPCWPGIMLTAHSKKTEILQGSTVFVKPEPNLMKHI